MKLAFIDMAGFRGVRETVRIDVPPGFLVIVGRNGSGKSTVCDAVEFALTGTIREHGHKEKGETYSDYLWWRGTAASHGRYVQLGLEDSEGVVHQVRRTAEGIDKESQAVLSKLFGSGGAPDNPLDALCRTSLIRDEEITALSVDLPESDRYKFVRDALGSVSFSGIEGRLDLLRKKCEERLRTEQRGYDRLRGRVADTTARLSELQASLASGPGNENIETILRGLVGLPESSTTELLEAARTELIQQRRNLDRLHRLLLGVQELDALRQTVLSKEYVERKVQVEQEVSQKEVALAASSAAYQTVTAEVENLRQGEPVRLRHAELLERGESIGRLPDDRCPLCGSTVSQQSFQEHVAHFRAEIQTTASGIVDALARQQEARRQRDDAERQLNDAHRLLSEHTVVAEKMESKLVILRQEAEVQGFPTNVHPPTIDDIRSVIESVRDKSRQLEEGIGWLESSSVTELVQSLEAELQQVKQSADEEFAAVSRTEKVISKVKDAQKGVKSLLGEIIDEQLSELSPLIEELYRRLRPHIEWTSMRYRLRGDVRRLLSFEVGDGLNPSFVFSSGQRRAAGLAFLLAVHLSRPWCLLESLLLDDPVQHVDDFRALNLTEVLASIRKSGRQVLCCVEDEALGQLMCRRLRSGTEVDGRIIRMQYDCERGVTKVFQEDMGPSRQRVLVPA